MAQEYDVALLDLDGVVYIGPDPVPQAADALATARTEGLRLAFVTNNAARTPQVVAAHLTELGVPANEREVVTSSMAAAHLLASLIEPGATVLVVGGEGLRSAIGERHFHITDTDDDRPAAVVQGYGPEVSWRMLAEAALAVRRGVPWVATNLDSTLPSPRGPLPGNGALVAAVTAATGRLPVSAGKPELPLHQEAVRRSNAQRPLVVGDRLDTDIEGAVRARCDSLLVLTGVTDAAHLLLAGPERRPTYVARDLRGLNETHPSIEVLDSGAVCGGWRAHRYDDTVEIEQVAEDDEINALRTLVSVTWANVPSELRLSGDRAALHDLGLDSFVR